MGNIGDALPRIADKRGRRAGERNILRAGGA